MTTWRAPTWRATAAAMMPIGPAPVTSTSSPDEVEGERRVHRVAERIEDRAELVVDIVGERHGVEGRDLHIVGEGAGDVHADAARLRIEMIAPSPRWRGSACR